jgi:hypothetical protein
VGGISIPQLSSTALLGAGSIVVFAQSNLSNANRQSVLGAVSGLSTQFRPPQWSQPALTMLTVPANYAGALNASSTASNAANSGAQAVGQVPGTQPSTATPNAVPQYLVFDGVMRLAHSQRARPTLHPIQDNASVTDHIILDPAHLVLDVLMTDVLPPYASGQWVGNPSKSISCFETLDNLRQARVPLTVTTRLKTYTNMFVVDVQPNDTVKERYGLRATVELQQIFLFNVSTQTVSARSQTTGNTTIGQTNPTPVPAGVQSQNGLPSSSTGALSPEDLEAVEGNVIGAGNYSSNNTGPLSVAVAP